jgi:hypothetical protein
VQTWIERVPLDRYFAGVRAGSDDPGPPALDRIKAMKREGWEITILTIERHPPRRKRVFDPYVLVLGYRS